MGDGKKATLPKIAVASLQNLHLLNISIFATMNAVSSSLFSNYQSLHNKEIQMELDTGVILSICSEETYRSIFR